MDLHPQYERVNEIEAPEINLGGGETTAAGIQALEVRYNLDDSELSDEDKAANAATYAKLIENTNSIPYITYNMETMGLIGAKSRGSIMALPTEDYPACVLVFDIPLMNETVGILSYEKYSIELSSDGNAAGFMMPAGFVFLALQAGMTFEQIMEQITANGLTPDIFSAFADKVLLNEASGGGYKMASAHLTHSSVTETRIEFIAEHPVTGRRRYYRCVSIEGGEDGILKAFDISGGVLYINPNEDTIEFNQDIFADTSVVSSRLDLTTFRIRKVNTYYTPISYDVHTTEFIMDYVQVTIYCDGAFETWQINSDGTTQQIS